MKSIFLCVLFVLSFFFSCQGFAAELATNLVAPVGFLGQLDAIVGTYIVAPYGSVMFYALPPFGMPLILAVLVIGGIFFTFRYGFIHVRLFRHSFGVLRGRYDNPGDPGEITHFQALTSALSATVGLGNIAGVAIAIQLGGPGAVFWLWMVAFFGMSMKFSCCTFAQLYRDIDPDTHAVLGGPMIYLKKGLAEMNLPRLGVAFSVLFSVMTIGGSFGGGNLFQVNQTYELLAAQFPLLQGQRMALVVGLVLAFFVGIVFLGGIKRIAEVTSKMVPAMTLFYCGSCLAIILANTSEVPRLFVDIFRQAFSPDAIYAGGIMGVIIQGVKRGSFSNEAGIGSSAIAHAAAKTNEPVREGVVAMLEPFVDTHVICTMTALTILISGVHLDPTYAGQGAQMTAAAFATLGAWMPYLLTIATVIFAYSTIISWSYYGERAWQHLFGKKTLKIYKLLSVLVVVVGPIISLKNVIDFSDLMILSMAFPNIIGMMLMSGKVRVMAKEYVRKLNAKEFVVYKA